MGGICLNCESIIIKYGVKYCSNKCQCDYAYKNYIYLWKNNYKSGNRGIGTKNFSKHVIKYINLKYYSKCAICGWSMINPSTNKSPLEINHIDGNSENNCENNLILLCPNCHSLTTNYRNLNKGNGRVWRRKKMW